MTFHLLTSCFISNSDVKEGTPGVGEVEDVAEKVLRQSDNEGSPPTKKQKTDDGS